MKAETTTAGMRTHGDPRSTATIAASANGVSTSMLTHSIACQNGGLSYSSGSTDRAHRKYTSVSTRGG